jgi:hypothetical protein
VKAPVPSRAGTSTTSSDLRQTAAE